MTVETLKKLETVQTPQWIFEHCAINPKLLIGILRLSFPTNGKFLWNLPENINHRIYGKLNHISIYDTKILPSGRLGLDRCHSAEIRQLKTKHTGAFPSHSHTRTHAPQRGLYAPMSQRTTISFLLSIHTVTCVEFNSCSDYNAKHRF